jgi:transcriptional regulator with XRE-family HTH domain
MAIKEIREAAGMSQESLAAAAGVTRVSIARYETGERVPSLEIAARIARALNCKIDDLMK